MATKCRLEDKPTQLTSKELVRLVRRVLLRIGLKAPIRIVVGRNLESTESDAVLTSPSRKIDEPVLLLELSSSLKRESTDYIEFVVQHEMKHYRTAKKRHQRLPFYQREEDLVLPESITWKPKRGKDD